MEVIDNINAELKYYRVEPAAKVIGEDGKFVEGITSEDFQGYAIVNKLTGITEHTSTILPGVIFQAQHFDNTLKSMLEKNEDTPVAEPGEPTDDVFIN